MSFLHLFSVALSIGVLYWLFQKYPIPIEKCCGDSVNQDDMPNEAWWKVLQSIGEGKSMVIIIKRIFVSHEYDQTLMCALTESNAWDRKALGGVNEKRDVFVRFESKVREGDGKMIHGMDIVVIEEGKIDSVNIDFELDWSRFKKGEIIGHAARVRSV